jgi:eukaryotic-like serine/threonine-protein kinase
MNITEPFVLPNDVVLIPCADLSDDMRGRMSYQDGDVTLSRRHGRMLAQVIDRETAELLALFRQPYTIADAVIEKSRALRKDPEAWLDELLPHLGKLLQDRILVPAGSEEEKELRPQYESGARIGAWEIVRCVHLVDDTEVYQLRSGSEVAALKIARSHNRALIENEMAILRQLDGAFAPRLIEDGEDQGRPYLIVEWIAGVDAGVAAAQRRHDRSALIELSASIAAAYAALHARGVLHTDVHPRNVIVGERVTLIDFGYARPIDAPGTMGRAGLHVFFEPEYIAERRQKRSSASPAGEQYSVAAMLHLLLTGRHYVEFRLEREEIERQIEHEVPLPFAARGIAPWAEVEEILFRALSKDPALRFASMAELAARLAAARDAFVRDALATPVSEEARALLAAMLRSFARGGELFASGYPNAPRASINFGCAGAAVALLRIAETRSDPALLALADVWRSRATALIGTPGAFHDDDLRRETVGEVTPYHTESGIHAAAAMIAAAMGNAVAQRRAVTAFLRASRKPCAQLDLTLGRSGSLLASAMLLDLNDVPELRAFGSETMKEIWSQLDACPPLPSINGMYVGMAHGWTGYLYAALRWCAASGDALPPRLIERLHELAALKTMKGRGAYWRVMTDSPANAMVATWCNGSAGSVFLFILAHRLLEDPQWLELAHLAAWNCWDEPCGPASLCCGSAGRAYALLNLYKHTGATEWLSRARQLANHAAANAAATAQRKNSLWKGEVGVGVVVGDLESPENARMPFFE